MKLQISKNTTTFVMAVIFAMLLGFSMNNIPSVTATLFTDTSNTPIPSYLTAQASQELEKELERHYPLRILRIDDPIINANAAYSLYREKDTDREKVLYTHNSDEPYPIASISKLMTAVVVVKHYDLNSAVFITPTAVATAEEFGQLQVGQILTVRDLLYILLMESSNDAATALAEVKGQQEFIRLMNEEAQLLGMKQTYFANPSGLDPWSPYEAANTSSPEDLSILISSIIDNHPLLFDILSLREFDLYMPNGQFHHTLSNTNILLDRAWPARVIGGKTGYTLRANGTLAIILETPDKEGTITNIILGADDRFMEMETLTSWLFKAYRW